MKLFDFNGKDSDTGMAWLANGFLALVVIGVIVIALVFIQKNWLSQPATPTPQPKTETPVQIKDWPNPNNAKG